MYNTAFINIFQNYHIVITMCMGLGCNAAGVVGARIIDSPREKLISILTNSFMPCNGRFPFLIAIATMHLRKCLIITIQIFWKQI